MSNDLTDWEYLRETPSAFVEQVIGEEAFDYQKEFMDADTRRKAFVSGRQVGKSRTASWMALHRAITHPGETVLITADAQRQASELFAQMRSEMDEAGITDDQWGVDRSTQTVIEFEHGSRILCLPTGRDGSTIRGYSADFIIVDEAAFVDDAIFEDVLEPMTFATGGEIVLCSTPYGTSGFFYDKATKWAIDDDYYSTWDPATEQGVSSYDNPLINDSDLDDFKEGKTDSQIAREVRGSFVEAGDLYFPPSIVKSSVVTSVSRSSSNVYAGVDVSGEGDAESVIALADETGNVFKFETIAEGTTATLNRLVALDNHHGFKKILIDRGGVGEHFTADAKEKIGRHVEDVFLSLQKKESVYTALKARMERTHRMRQAGKSGPYPIEICHDPDLQAQIDNMGYSKTANGHTRIQPKDETLNDDYPDALGLAVWALPDTPGSSGRGATGTTKSHRLGGISGEGSNRGYTFGATPDDEDDNLGRVTTRSSSRKPDWE